MTFKEQLQNDFIPRIKDMLSKEEIHYEWLFSKWAEDNDDAENFDFFYKATEDSKHFIEHYKLRLKQYIDYAEKL